MSKEQKAVRLFYSYSHKDEEFREQLETHLAILRRRRVIDDWHDRRITPGTDWRNEIGEQLELANVILLLVTPDFIASDFCYEQELATAIERHHRGEVVVVPIIVRPVDFEDSAFSHLQALPTDAKPITLWENRDQAWLNVAKGLRKLCTGTAILSLIRSHDEVADESAIEPDDAFASISEEDFGLLDFNALLEERIADVVTTQELIGTRTSELGDFLKEKTTEMVALADYKGKDKARRAQLFSKTIGLRLAGYASDMSGIAVNTESSWGEVTRIFPLVLSMIVEQNGLDESTRLEMKELDGTLAVLEQTIEGAKDSVEITAQRVVELGKHGAFLKIGAERAATSMLKIRDAYWGILSTLGQMRRQVQDVLRENDQDLLQ